LFAAQDLKLKNDPILPGQIRQRLLQEKVAGLAYLVMPLEEIALVMVWNLLALQVNTGK